MRSQSSTRSDPVTVGDFLEMGGSRLAIELVAGEAGLSRRIGEAAINRPGLGLSGFFEHFANRRIQVIGWHEHSFLRSMDREQREEHLREFFQQKIPCVVVARQKGVGSDLRNLATEFRVPVFRTAMITKHFVNAATIIMENLMAPRMIAQGTMVEIQGIGVLIEGKAGMGKSETALALIRRGFALIADDVTCLRRDSSGAIIGSPSAVTQYHMEIRGLGIIHVSSLFGVAAVRDQKRVDLVATLCEPGTEEEFDRSGETVLTREFLGVGIPQIFIPVAPGRDLANVVETAALNQKLKRLGHDAEKELDEKLVALLTEGLETSE